MPDTCGRPALHRLFQPWGREMNVVRGVTQEPDLGGWVLRGGVAAFFVLMGSEKFASGPGAPWVAFFQQIGIGQWFRYLTGFMEIGGAVLYVVPRTGRIGATMLACTMAGAMAVH